MKRRAVIAMSGGVDSTAAAWLLKQQGWELTAVNLLMLPGAAADEMLISSCKSLDIPLIIRDCTGEFFERVLLPGAKEYAAGRTPNPCCECNAVLKFRELFNTADELGIETVATGHYALSIAGENGNVKLGCARDNSKDQSYFLYRLTQSELRRCLFPLGEYLKSEVRQIAADAALLCASRPDSQDACFQIPGECCGDTLSRLCKFCGKQGRFIHQGKTVGRHQGIHRYTIGQRQGLGVALGVPAYISHIDPLKGDITLTTDQNDLLSGSFCITRAVWQRGMKPAAGELFHVKVRYRTAKVKCRCIELDNSVWRVIPEAPLRAVTPGQAAVFYDEAGFLAGGGVISAAVE